MVWSIVYEKSILLWFELAGLYEDSIEFTLSNEFWLLEKSVVWL